MWRSDKELRDIDWWLIEDWVHRVFYWGVVRNRIARWDEAAHLAVETLVNRTTEMIKVWGHLTELVIPRNASSKI